MPARELQHQLDLLREQLNSESPVSVEQREELTALAQQIELQLEREAIAPDASLVDGVNLAVDRFEVEHPTIAGTLRNIVQSLVSMGI